MDIFHFCEYIKNIYVIVNLINTLFILLLINVALN